jgi:hypothetical protein
VRNEFVEAQLEYLRVVAPDGTNQSHARLPDVDAVAKLKLIFWIVWAFWVCNIVDYTQAVQAFVHHFEQEMLFVNSLFFKLEIMRF